MSVADATQCYRGFRRVAARSSPAATTPGPALLVATCAALGSATPLAGAEPCRTEGGKTLGVGAGPTLAFGGDVMFGRYDDRGLQAIATKPSPFANIVRQLASDLTIVNLETPLLWAPPAKSRWGTYLRFAAGPTQAAVLAAAGVDVVNLANNHAHDASTLGLGQTSQVASAAGLGVVGEPVARKAELAAKTVVVGNRRVALVAATAVANWRTPRATNDVPLVAGARLTKRLVPAVTAAARGHDIVVVILHWGTEYATAPSPWQIATAHALVDAGADVVVGSHPHVLQGIEAYRGKLIAYSLGNLLFDNARPVQREGGLLRVTFGAGDNIAAGDFVPTELSAPAFAIAAAPTLDHRIIKLSAAKPLQTTWRADATGLHWQAAPSAAPPAPVADADAHADAAAADNGCPRPVSN